MSCTYKFKCVIIGDTGASKHDIVNYFIGKRLRQEHDFTIDEIGSKILDLDGTIVNLQILDTPGGLRFRCLMHYYYRPASGAFLVFDISQRDSFRDIARWMKEVRHENPKMTIMLVGNSLDLQDSRVVPCEEAEYFAREMGYYIKRSLQKLEKG